MKATSNVERHERGTGFAVISLARTNATIGGGGCPFLRAFFCNGPESLARVTPCLLADLRLRVLF